VDHSLLRSWLGLSPGPWPPDHYALVGLTPGPVDPEDVERIVLDRMARLRSHQLLHPEVVTEGMNRLAQALVCLTDPIAKAVYDTELGLPPPPPQPAGEKGPRSSPPPLPDALSETIPGFPIPTDEEPLPPDATQVIEVRFTAGLAPPDVGDQPHFEVVEDEPPGTPAFPFEVVSEPVLEPEFIVPPPPPWQPRTRRELYTRLTTIRRVRAAWARLKPHLADPREPLDRPLTVLTFLEAVIELRATLGSLPDLIGEPWRPGGLAVALLRQPLVLDAFRVLLPDQRRTVSLDWRNGDTELEREYNRLRELSRSGRKRRPFRRRSRIMRALFWTLRHPESLAVGLAIVVLVVALIRGSVSR
jgi:hypothetical protein